MGVFDERRTFIASSTQTLIEDTPDYIKQSLLNSIIAGRDIVPDILDSTLNCFAVKDIKPMYEYAKYKYTNGLPEGSKGWYPAPDDAIARAIAAENPWMVQGGRRIKIMFSALGPPNAHFIGLQCLVQDPYFTGWDQRYYPWPEIFTYPYRGKPSPMTYDTTKLNFRGVPIYVTAYRYRTTNGGYRYLKYYNFKEPIIPTGTYYNVEYEIINSNGTKYTDRNWPTGRRYWTYYPGRKRFPELNLESDSGKVPDGTYFFPVVPLRVNKVSYTDPSRRNTSLYQTSKKLLSYMDVDIEELHEGVNRNPSIGDVNHAYVIFGIDINTKSNAGIDYLFEYFQDEYARASTREQAYMAWYNGARYSHPPYNAVNISDATYKVTVVFSYITITDTNGVIGNVGDTTIRKSIFTSQPHTSFVPGAKNVQYEDHRNVLYLRKQTSPTTYRTIAVHGLCMANNIHGSGQSWWTNLWGAVNLNGGDQANAPLVIPLNVGIAYENISTRDANTLYYESIKIVFNAFQVVKLKWYETSFFQFVTQVVLIAFSAMSGGMASLISSLQAAAAAGVVSLAVFIGKMVITSILAEALFTFAAEELGLEGALAITAAMIIYGMTGQKGLFNLPFADDMLFIGSGLQQAGQAYMGTQIADIQAQMEEVAAEQEQQQAELAKINEDLQMTSQLDPLGLFTQVGMSPLDTPDSFIQRSIMPNPGIYSISAVSNFVENSLMLPQRM
ncbi:hypothetical protein pVco7_gp114 [Vibrio phage pVco-7]|uniref:Uncharacterized protein n=1 Tax=Vibrio phage pVco-5 TaxID=1965485 RepID=A0A1W6JUY4_9CAUD|nr:hypothetical protein KNT61_gp115 [Vibrio phage pVco-5]ARM71103.1 hypothetical protein pVco5_114 [Vibrio phage pVco-5]